MYRVGQRKLNKTSSYNSGCLAVIIQHLPPINPTQPPQNGPGLNTTHTYFHMLFVLLFHIFVFMDDG